MEFHKPKAVHNWREFLKELGTIALGVCIALAAEQTVEWLHWRAQVSEARAVIASEMARNVTYAIMRTRIARCESQRLMDLSNMLDAAARQGSLPPVGAVGGTIQTPWSTGAWDGVMASQTATHFSREQLAALSLVYRRVERIEAWNREESEAWALIHSMEGPGRRLDPPLQAELRKAINLASYLNGVINNSGVRMIRQVMDENLPFTPGERRDMAQAMKYQLPAWGCGKITLQPPPGYIQTVYGPGFQNEMDSLEKALPAFLALPKQ